MKKQDAGALSGQALENHRRMVDKMCRIPTAKRYRWIGFFRRALPKAEDSLRLFSENNDVLQIDTPITSLNV